MAEKLIGFDSDLTIRREIDRVLHLHRVEVQVVMEFDNIETIKRAIEIDAGVSLLPEPTVLREVAAGTLVAVPLDTDELVRPLGIIHRRGKELSAPPGGLSNCCKREGRSAAGGAGGESVGAGRRSGNGAAATTARRPRTASPRIKSPAKRDRNASVSASAPRRPWRGKWSICIDGRMPRGRDHGRIKPRCHQ